MPHRQISAIFRVRKLLYSGYDPFSSKDKQISFLKYQISLKSVKQPMSQMMYNIFKVSSDKNE